MHPTNDVEHDLREGATLALGWLETVFRHWDKLNDGERREMIAAALLGANEIVVALDRMAGHAPSEIRLPEDRMADELEKVAEKAL
jgi:sugar phosphate isomerase/epimerase